MNLHILGTLSAEQAVPPGLLGRDLNRHIQVLLQFDGITHTPSWQADKRRVVGWPGATSGAVEPVFAADFLGAVLGRNGAHFVFLQFPLGHRRLLLLPGETPADRHVL